MSAKRTAVYRVEYPTVTIFTTDATTAEAERASGATVYGSMEEL